MNKITFVLEPSSNTHTLVANDVKSKTIDIGILQLEIEGAGIVSHGEHGTVVTESKNVIKYNQMELNPVTKSLQNAFD